MAEPATKHKKIHLTKFMQGRATPNEVHRALGIHKKCVQCGAPASVRIRVLVSYEEMVRRQPEFIAQIMVTNPNGSFVLTVPTIHGKMILISDVGACSGCRKSAEVAAAKGPSWAIVEIDAGPDEHNRVVSQVPQNLVSLN